MGHPGKLHGQASLQPVVVVQFVDGMVSVVQVGHSDLLYKCKCPIENKHQQHFE